MRAAKMKERPTFQLMCQTDVQSIYHMQMPRWLFSDPRYCEMSLDAKVTYTFLLNRFQLSRKNGWVNDRGEVFVIFPRKALAKELRICEQRVTAAFKKLVELKLVWEKRCGRGDANQIYLARVTPIEDPDYWKHWTLCWSLQRRSPDFTRKTDCMNPFSCALPETEREPDTFSAWHGWTPLLTLQPFPV